MSIVGIAKRGFGRALRKYKQKKATAKMKSGTSTRAERLEFGKRDKDIKSVPPSPTVKKGDVTESVRRGKQHFYLKNIDEVNKHNKAISEGEKAKKKLKHMTETKRAYHIGKSIHPRDPAKGKKQIGE
jgi:hypothetical protein